MKNNVKHIIWTSWIDVDDWRDGIKEECEMNGMEYDEDKLYYMAYETNSHYLEDEKTMVIFADQTTLKPHSEGIVKLEIPVNQ